MEFITGAGQQADVFICPVYTESTGAEWDVELRPEMKKRGAVTWFYGRGQEQDMLFIGMGEVGKFNLEVLRDAAGNAGREVSAHEAKAASVSLAFLESSTYKNWTEELLSAWVEGWLLGTYVFDKYKSTKRPADLDFLYFEGEVDSFLEGAVKRAQIRASATSFARDLCNEAPNDLHPLSFVERIITHFADRDVTVRVYKGEELKQRHMNGLLAVGSGSQYPPALVEIEYVGDSEAPLLALIGKGITFDMGGMNVKNGRDISDARFDMGGAAAVIGAMDILTKMEVKTRVTALIAIADNAPDAKAFLPSDVVRYPNGLSVQVVNTDAEGRLILADALLHAKRLGAEEMIDIATLTGSVGHALGLRIAGIWGDKGFSDQMISIGEQNGDPIWSLPLVDEDEELLSSPYADLANLASSPYGGANMAALFLRNFVSPTARWCHIDMANTVQVPSNRGYRVTGATGYGVRLLADFVCAKVFDKQKAGESL
ncbi:leucyl aminopeptidase family protein [Paenibacillus pini]|uniref:Probable cytosol aminopeptidase n=1 Tax=Paenibacillus pini JCM 16418 TaxID=1236976 RepID=W7YNN9_9BACL|nr:leucyl aminopeptidase family protein [Paenibacillus pini]GAF06261.1 cytosol aminopeptidase PepA [Paenibacillus pini JCM 16418]